MKQFGTIFRFELFNYIKSKAFIALTLVFVLILAGVMFFPRVKNLFDDGEEVASNPEDIAIMLVSASEEGMSELYAEAFGSAFVDYNVKVADGNIDSIKEKIKSGEIECAIVVESPTEYTYYVNNLTMYDMNSEIANEVMLNIYRMNAMALSGVAPEAASAILSTPIVANTENLGVDQMQNFFYAYVMIFALYMVILLYGQMVTMNVATEKSSRAMEVLITSAKPESMMFGKVFASCLAGFIQLVLIFGSALLFYNINRDYWTGFEFADMFFDIPPMLLGYMLVFFVLGFLVYGFMFGAAGSTVTKLEEANTAVTPLMLAFIFMFMVVMTSMGSGDIDSMLMRVCSFIPLTSPMAMFTRIALSDVPTYEIVISIAILVASVFGIGVFSAKIYRVGVLLYGTPPKISAVIKAMKKA